EVDLVEPSGPPALAPEGADRAAVGEPGGLIHFKTFGRDGARLAGAARNQLDPAPGHADAREGPVPVRGEAERGPVSQPNGGGAVGAARVDRPQLATSSARLVEEDPRSVV